MIFKTAIIFKTALTENALLDTSLGRIGMVKTASGNVIVEPGSDKAKIIEAEIEKHPTALFFRAKAIKANEPNSNGDYFSEEELIKAYKSFEGVPFFTNHDNQNIENARGKIIFAEWIPEEKSVYTISFVDREAFPHICRSIEEEYVTGVSMGCSVDYSVCNICGNKAEKTEDYCSHIRNRKGRNFSGRVKNVTTGEMKEFKNQLVFEFNYGIKFIELSAVVDPACPSCHIEGIIPNDGYMSKVANIQNTLYMIRTAAIEKNAGQEEISQLNQCIDIVESLSVALVTNRSVDPDFASQLVGILSELKSFSDELIGAGYGNVESQVPGVGEMPEEGMMGEVPAGELAPDMAGQGLEATPVGAENPLGVGSVSGVPGQPLATSPQLPITAPAKPLAFEGLKIQRIANLVSDLSKRIYNAKGDSEMAKRRTIAEKKVDQKDTVETLSNSWKEKQAFLEYIKQVPSIQSNDFKLSVKKRDDTFIIVAESKDGIDSHIWTYEDLTEREKELIKDFPSEASKTLLETFASSLRNIKEGVEIMSDTIKQEAGANSVNKAPEVITEAQLEGTRDLYHAREDADRETITEDQLKGDKGLHARTGEQEVITEAQFEASSTISNQQKLHKREDAERETITEDQLKNESNSGASPRTETEQEEITQKQLRNDPTKTTGTEKDVITEKQLDEIASPWERAASRDSSLFKSAGDHMSAVVDVVADTVVSTGCTPEEAVGVAGSLVESTKDRYGTLNAIQDEASGETVDQSKRLAFWSTKNVKVAGTGASEIAASIVDGLRRVASDATINPEVVIEALDVISEGSNGSDSISKRVEEKLEAASAQEEVVSSKDELRAALTDSDKEEREEERGEVLASVGREGEREQWEKDIDSGEVVADHILKTNFEEIGFPVEQKQDRTAFRSVVKGFVKGAFASLNKTASITNVTISGDTITIAVQTEDGQSVEIPIGEEMAPADAEVVPEMDMMGEGLEGGIDSAPLSEPMASGDKVKREAQFGGGTGGGVSGTPSGAAAPEAGLDAPAPEGDALQSLTTDDGSDFDAEIPTAGEQQMPYAICPECGSSDVDIERKASGIGADCNNCGAEYEALIKKAIEFTIVKPTRSIGEEGIESPDAPEVPALPVAAQTKLDKGSLTRIASNREAHGHVCPACGMGECKATSEADGSTEFTCPACNTDVEKHIMVSSINPEDSFLRVQWDVVPNLDCEDCADKAEKFASMIKVEKMMKAAAHGDYGNTNYGNSDFPMANCVERIARRWGGNVTATFGPCKGKPLADCVCGQLEKLGLRTVRHMEKLASVYVQQDPMDKCIDDYMNGDEKYSKKEASHICGCLKKKYASENDDNAFLQAFAEDIESGKEKILTAQDLRTINDSMVDQVPEVPADEYADVDMGEPLEEETITLELKKDTAEEIFESVDTALAEVEAPVEEGIPEMGAATALEVGAESEDSKEILESEAIEAKIEESASAEKVETINSEEEKEMATAMKTHQLRRVGEEVVKIAATPKEVEDIEGNVEAGVPRAEATMGHEGADNINVEMKKPDVPRADATMGQESAENINKPAGLPDVAVDSSYMGDEQSVQSGMPPINNEIKGTVIAEGDKATKEAKKLKEVDTVEDDVEAGVPRADATMGHEGSDNIDVEMKKPDVPRADATMGEESAENIDVKADAPDVPIGKGEMGHEKEVQKDMPGTNDKYLKNVQQKKEVQLERIATARRMKAVEVTAKLLASHRIKEEAYDDVVEVLSKLEIDKIADTANTMFPKQVRVASTATTTAGDVYAGPAIVMESKPVEANTEEDFVTKLSSSFTIGNKEFDENLTRYGVK